MQINNPVTLPISSREWQYILPVVLLPSMFWMDRWKGWASTSKWIYYSNSILACASLTSLGNHSLFSSLSFAQHTNKQENYRFTQAQGTLKPMLWFKEIHDKTIQSHCVLTCNKNTDTKLQSTGDIFFLRSSFWRKTISHIMFSSNLFYFILSRFIAAWDSPWQENLARLQEVPNYRGLRFFTVSCSFHCWTLLKQVRLN